ncbi:MAG: hypothetical protein ACOC7U_08100 [Spirochaetota bacterium]
MSEMDSVSIEQEVEQYRREKESIRKIVDRIGGRTSAKRRKITNVFFITAVLSLSKKIDEIETRLK